MKALDWLKSIHSTCRFMSIETPGKVASNSELQRWIDQGSVLVNAERLDKKEEIDFPIISVVLFPKSQTRRCTLF